MTLATAMAVLEALLRADLGVNPPTQDRRGHDRPAGYLQRREREALYLALGALAQQLIEEAADA